MIDLWHVFEREFQRHVWDQVDPINMPLGYQQNYMLRLLQDAAGLGGCKMMRRVIGLAGVEDIRGIADVDERAIAGSLGLNIGQALLKNRARHPHHRGTGRGRHRLPPHLSLERITATHECRR